ncbi:MAG: FTR1 family protein [Candidatus Omnitrophica bacterium]|nr:FTR1 family protein [Candidatus Omnitrophota bacterium]
MHEATLFSTFLVVFREALEASLIVGIILTVLAKLKDTRYIPHVIVSSLLAVFASLAIGFLTFNYFASIKGDIKTWIEAVVSVLASGVLTYMVVWMDSQARKIRSDIELKMETALSREDLFMILAMPFLAVFREGAETVLFLSAIATQSGSSVSFAGALGGLTLGVFIVCGIFAGGKKIPLRPLFKVSGILLVFMAAGLLAYGIHEFHELGVIPEGIKEVWNINHIVSDKKGVGVFLKALFGYNGNPSLVEVSAYLIYFAGIVWFLRSRKAVSV